jgi:hypothetical protein
MTSIEEFTVAAKGRKLASEFVRSPLMKIHDKPRPSLRATASVPRGEVAFSGAEAGEIARRLGGQTLSSGADSRRRPRQGRRREAARSADEAERIAGEMLA